jgi:hypothetical protein
MNEQIEGLWWQARIGYNNQNCDPEVVAKFAELIVRECTELTLDYKSDDYYNGWLDYRDEIKRHFGVEE